MAGGAAAMALDLDKLGYVAADGPYTEEAVRAWCAGEQAPESDLLFALARYYELSLDEYVFGEPEDASLREAIHGFHQKRDQLREVLREALREALRELVQVDEAFEPTGLAVAP